MKNIVCGFPLWIKQSFMLIKLFFDVKKRMAINNIWNLKDDKFFYLNSKNYKNNLKKALGLFLLSSDETKLFVEYLYNDEFILVNESQINWDNPTIICVVKNEYDKLIHFFNHYNKLGNFNYLFIDNGSTDSTLDLLKKNNAVVYSVKEQFSTLRKVAWINKVYSLVPKGSWTLLLDADELTTYCGYEETSFNDLIKVLEKNKCETSGALMVDMFSEHPCKKDEYIENYLYFENSFHMEKSFYFNSVYGGIREREFKMTNERTFLIKKHPLVKKEEETLLIHCHYVYPFKLNFNSKMYLALIHYKLFDSEIEKYKKIAADGSYGNGGGSLEYKAYIQTLLEKSYEEIFAPGINTIKFDGTTSLQKIELLEDIREMIED